MLLILLPVRRNAYISTHISPPQRWLNALQDHCAYSTHYTTMPHVILMDELDEDYLPLGSMEDALKVPTSLCYLSFLYFAEKYFAT